MCHTVATYLSKDLEISTSSFLMTVALRPCTDLYWPTMFYLVIVNLRLLLSAIRINLTIPAGLGPSL